MKHILIDFENVQPEPGQLDSLDNENCHIWLFLGKLQQKNLSVELCEALCRFGRNVHFVRIAKTGKNALDFYLTYYLGKITEQDKEALICVLSRDSGFDVLVEHLEDNRLCSGIVRLASLGEVDKPIALPESQSVLQDTQWIAACQRKVIQTLMKRKDLRKSGRNNLISVIHKFILNDELAEYDDTTRAVTASLIVDRLLAKGVLTAGKESGLLSYHFVSAEALLEKIVQRVESAKAKTLLALRNVIKATAHSAYHDVSENEITDFVDYLKQRKMLKQLQDKIIYPPFEQEEKASYSKAEIIEDSQILKKVNQLFTKSAKNRPGNRKALANSLKATLKIQNQEVEQLIQVLVKRKKFSINDGGKVVYPQ